MKMRKLIVLLLALSLLLTVMSGCGQTRDPNILTPEEIVKENLFENDVLNEINAQLDGRLVRANYTNDFYKYSITYPGLARVDNYGFQSAGSVRGNLHRTVLDAAFGMVKIYHPQEGQMYHLLDHNSALPVDEQTDNPDSPEVSNNPTTPVSNGEPALERVVFNSAQYSDGALLYQNFFSRLDFPSNFGSGNSTAKNGNLNIEKTNSKLSGVNWTRTTLSDDDGSFRQIYSAYVQDIPFVFEVTTDPLTRTYQNYDYLALFPYAELMESIRLELIETMISGIAFHSTTEECLNQFDHGLLNQNPMGGQPMRQLTGEGHVVDFQSLELGADQENLLSALYFDSSRDNSAIEGYYRVDEQPTEAENIIYEFINPICISDERTLANEISIISQESFRLTNAKVGKIDLVFYEIKAQLAESNPSEPTSGDALEADPIPPVSRQQSNWLVCSFKIDQFKGVLVNRGFQKLDQVETFSLPSLNSMKYSLLFAAKSIFDTDGKTQDRWSLNDLPGGNPLKLATVISSGDQAVDETTVAESVTPESSGSPE